MSGRDADFASLAHDLSQLLWAIQGRARVLASRVPAEFVDGLETIAVDAGLAAAMLNEPDSGACDLKQQIDAAWRLAGDHQGEVQRWQWECTGATPGVALPAAVVRRVLGNLLVNALEAMPRGGRVACHVVVEGQKALVTIADDGPGLPADVLTRLFQPGTSSNKAGGHGLGLAGARALLRRHGADLVHVPSPVGAVFRLELPLAEVPVPDSSRPVAATRPFRLLVVDDEPAVRAMLVDVLATLGHEARVAANYEAALAGFAPDQYDAAVVDLGLPGRDGEDLARELRGCRPGPGRGPAHRLGAGGRTGAGRSDRGRPDQRETRGPAGP